MSSVFPNKPYLFLPIYPSLRSFRFSLTVTVIVAYLRNCANTTSAASLENARDRAGRHQAQRSAPAVGSFRAQEETSLPAETRGVNHGPSGTIRPSDSIKSCYLPLIPSSFCASLRIERSATSLRETSRSTLAVFFASSMISRSPASGTEPSSLKTRTAPS